MASRFEEKFGVRSPNKRKNLGSSGTTRGKKLGHNPGERESYLICLNITLKVTREYTTHENSQRFTTQIFGVISEI